MYKKIYILLLLIFFGFLNNAYGSPWNKEIQKPTCNTNGEIICKENLKPSCPKKKNGAIGEPKCLFLGAMFIPGCWEFVGINNYKVSLGNKDLDSMMMITGGGETYTLNTETVFCKKK